MIHHSVNNFIHGFKKKLFFDFCDYRNTIFLAGSGRSGTTWIQENLNYDNQFRIMFEPFYPYQVKQLKGWNNRQYIRFESSDKHQLKIAEKILSGKIRHEWIDRQNNRNGIFKKRILKDIRSNLLIKWVKEHFSEIPIIFLMRHPCAVANSKMKLNWNNQLEDVLMQQDLMDDFLNPFKKIINTAKDVYDKHLILWCIENYVPLKQFKDGEMLIVLYENVCMNPIHELNRLLSFIGGKIFPDALERLSNPSALTRKESAINTGKNMINSWKSSVPDKKIDRTIGILSEFGLDKLYNAGGMPIIHSDDVLNLF